MPTHDPLANETEAATKLLREEIQRALDEQEALARRALTDAGAHFDRAYLVRLRAQLRQLAEQKSVAIATGPWGDILEGAAQKGAEAVPGATFAAIDRGLVDMALANAEVRVKDMLDAGGKFINAEVTKAIVAGKSLADISESLRKGLDLGYKDEGVPEWRADLIAASEVHSIYRQAQVQAGEKMGFTRYSYEGPMDDKTTDICAEYVGEVLTKEEWAAVSQKVQDDPDIIFLYGLHYGCRHTLVPVPEGTESDMGRRKPEGGEEPPAARREAPLPSALQKIVDRDKIVAENRAAAERAARALGRPAKIVQMPPRPAPRPVAPPAPRAVAPPAPKPRAAPKPKAAPPAPAAATTVPKHAAAWREMKSVDMKTNGARSANATYFATLEDGTKVVFKPQGGEYGFKDGKQPLRGGVEPGTYYQREVTSYRVANELGFTTVPETDIQVHKVRGKEVIGSSQKFITEKFRGGSEEYVFRDRGLLHTFPVTPEMRKNYNRTSFEMSVLDIIMQNSDRHPGNWLIGEKTGRVYAIDNGLMMSATDHLRKAPRDGFRMWNTFEVTADEVKGMLANWKKEDWGAAIREVIQSDRTTLNQLKGITAEQVESAAERATFIKAWLEDVARTGGVVKRESLWSAVADFYRRKGASQSDRLCYAW